MKLVKAIIFSVAIFWPISLFLHNTPSNFFVYTLPALLLFISFRQHKTGSKYFFLPILAIPFISPKLALIPLLLSIIFLLVKTNKYRYKFFILSSLIFILFFKPFWGQTIFKPDYEARQLILRNINLYPTPLFARTFQNKGVVILNKFNNNFFSLIDPTNYFFGFHPRENYVDNQNLDKFPYLSLPFFLVGLFFIKKYKYKFFLIASFTSSLFVLSILTNFDRNDFILYVPLTIIILNGIKYLQTKYKQKLKPFILAYLIFTAHQFIRLFIL